ncbi:site-specific integrase [Cohnella panacarvi]|uniref:site-specific integrase n=1 Tax=Cohnella panacarvi TaxID=400776 RepID=UPI00047924B6
MFELAASTGMRKSEILGMPRTDVFLDTAIMSVRQAYTKGEDGYEIDDTKNNSSVRPVPLFDDTVEYLRTHLAEQEKERAKEGYNDHGLLFQTSTGTPIYQRNLMRNYYRIIRRVMNQQEKLKAAGKPYVEFKPIRFHDLRHTHATILLKNGVHPKVVQERLGHSSIQVTLNTYSHVIPNLQESILKSIGTSITGSKGTSAKLPNVSEKTAEPIVGVDYDSGDLKTYRGITIDWEGKQSRISTGDFYRDLGYVQAEYSPFKMAPSFEKFMMEKKQKK